MSEQFGTGFTGIFVLSYFFTTYRACPDHTSVLTVLVCVCVSVSESAFSHHGAKDCFCLTLTIA